MRRDNHPELSGLGSATLSSFSNPGLGASSFLCRVFSRLDKTVAIYVSLRRQSQLIADLHFWQSLSYFVHSVQKYLRG